MDFQTIVNQIGKECKALGAQGKVADYIPALAKVNRNRFGFCVTCLDGNEYGFGDVDIPLSVQSVSKVFPLILVLSRIGESIFSRVGIEPSGTSFNSLIQLEQEAGIPRNPFMNAGALVVVDSLIQLEDNPVEAVLSFLRDACGNPGITINEEVKLSEKEAGHRNQALCAFMKSFGNIASGVDDVLDVYFSLCSVEMTVRELSRTFGFLANGGVMPKCGRVVLNPSKTKRLSALLLTCGLYDEAGEFAYRVGLPAKSGVGGAIVGAMPGHFSTCAWAPGLNHQGNSILAMKALEELTTRTGLSIF